nr:MAG TPA: hypothetical protein [Caudoviricetes sp.]
MLSPVPDIKLFPPISPSCLPFTVCRFRSDHI